MAHPPSEASSGPLGQAFASALLRDEILLVLVLDREARIAAFNPACERTLGVRGAEVLGEPVWTLVPEDQRSDLRAAFQNVLETGRSALHEGEWTTGSGHRLRIASCLSPIGEAGGTDAHVGITGVDLTEAHSGLPELAGIVRSAMDAIVSVNAAQQIVLFNPAAEGMFGRKAADVMLQPLEILLPMRFRAAHHEHVERFTRSGQTGRRMGQLGSIWGLRASGEEFPAEASISQARSGGEMLLTVIIRDVTELRAAEERSFESASHLSSIIDSAMDALVAVDESQNIVLFNPAAERMFGRRRAEMLGRPLDGLIPQHFRSAHREHIARFAGSGHTNRRMGRLGHVWGLRADGQEFPVEASISQARLGDRRLLTVILRDSTERERAASTAALLASIVRSSEDAIIGTDLDGRILTWNPAAQEMFGYPLHEAETKAFTSLVVPDKREETERALAGVRRGHSVGHLETVGLSSADRRFEMSLSVSPRRVGPGAITGASIVARDISEHRSLERRLRQTEELAALATLVTGIAHDIGTPMNVILGYTDMLARSLREEKNLERIRIIKEQIERVTRLIQTLMNFARPQHETPRLARVEDVVERALNLIVETARKRDIAIARDFAETPRVPVRAERLERAFLDLLVNACDAMPDGGTLRVTTRPLRDGVEIRIDDDGTGIAPEVLDRIFEPFFTTKPRGKGTGLGLLVTRSIALEHGGTIDVQSELGKGTCFAIWLPRESPAEAKGDAAPSG